MVFLDTAICSLLLHQKIKVEMRKRVNTNGIQLVLVVAFIFSFPLSLLSPSLFI